LEVEPLLVPALVHLQVVTEVIVLLELLHQLGAVAVVVIMDPALAPAALVEVDSVQVQLVILPLQHLVKVIKVVMVLEVIQGAEAEVLQPQDKMHQLLTTVETVAPDLLLQLPVQQ
jgi:hypothetical protein